MEAALDGGRCRPQLEDYLGANPVARVEWDEHQKLKDDPRITAAGRLIRKTSLDELPQLWNILRGDMSLVGPRPMMPQQAELYPGRDYYLLRPGLTGFWQISDRNETSFAARAAYDTQYCRRVSLLTDILVLSPRSGWCCAAPATDPGPSAPYGCGQAGWPRAVASASHCNR